MKVSFLNSAKIPFNYILKLGCFLFVLIIINSLNATSQTVRYVTQNGTGNGNTWLNASGNLQLMINSSVAGDQIWVAGGIYKPTYRPDNMSNANPSDRVNTFLLKKDVKVYGGFAGSENTLINRDLSITANASILSGNLDNQATDTDNAYHVIVSVGDVGTAELNGFTIKDGNANGSGGSTLVDGFFLDYSKAGGIYLTNSSPTLINLIISGNKAKYYGGGIYVYGSPVITNVILRGNHGAYGGGICLAGSFIQTSDPTLTNVLITGNSSTQGGGIFGAADVPILNNVTISGNTGDREWWTGSSPNNAVIRNSIVYGNGVHNDYMNYKNSIIQSHSSTADGNVVFTGSVTELFVNPANGNYNLKSGSICVDAGFNGYFPGLNASTKDLAGNSRVFNYGSGGIIDIGAYESNFKNITPTSGIVYVTITGSGDFSGSSWANATNDIQNAINGTGVQQVWVAGGIYKPTYRPDNMSNANPNDRVNTFLLKKDVKIYGGFAGSENLLINRDLSITANASILSGNLNNQLTDADNAYHVVVSVGDIGSAELNGFTIKDGNANGTTFTSIDGTSISSGNAGGIYLSTSSPTLINLIISGNKAFYYGGGIYLSGGSPVITNVILRGNHGEYGGGICWAGTFTEISDPILTNVLITGNSSSSGGGIFNAFSIPLPVPTLNNVTISGNTGDLEWWTGNEPNNAVIRNSIVYGNGVGNDYMNYKNSIIQNQTSTADGNVVFTGSVTELFVDPDNNNYTLKAGSPAINTGDNFFFPDLNANTKDLAGNPRVFNFAGGGIIDMGAYESSEYLATAITSQPFIDQNVCLGGSLQILQIEATGDELTYQWYVENSRANFNGVPVSNGNNISYTPPTNQAGTYYYYVVVTGLGGEAISEYATVKVKSKPNTPVVSGTVNVCNNLGTRAGLTYTAEPDEDVLYYSWSIGPKVSIVNGQGTNSIVVRFEVDFATSAASKQIRVTSTSACGTSDMAIFYLAAQLPQTPGQISGPTEACSYVGTVNEATYQIADVTSASSYIWTVPAGATIVGSSDGTSINVIYDNTFTGGNVSVIAVNSCGASSARSFVVKRTTPSTPGPISGSKNICMFLPSVANPTGLTGTFSVTSNPYVSYLWNVPAGIVIESQTNSGTEDIITVSFNSNYAGGSISVVATSQCGTSASRVLNLAQLTPGSVGGILEVSAGDCQDRTYVYSVASMPTNSVSLEWTVPAEATIISGQGTTSITVVYPNVAVAGVIAAQGNNGCGNSNKPRTFAVKLAACESQDAMVKGNVKVSPSNEIATDQLEVKVYPNPSTTTFILRATSSNANEIMHVRILDNLGREFKRLQMKSGETISFGSELKAGNYFVEVMQGKEKTVKKVLKF